MTFEVLAAVLMEIQVFCDMTLSLCHFPTFLRIVMTYLQGQAIQEVQKHRKIGTVTLTQRRRHVPGDIVSEVSTDMI